MDVTDQTIADLEAIETARDHWYRRRADLAVTSEEAAAQFIDEVGFCFLFPVKGIELPTLWEAVKGSRRPSWPKRGDDELSLTWQWKDSLPARKRVVYGKFLRGKPTLVSREMFACLCALTEYPDPEDWELRYEDGKLSSDGRRIYQVLLNGGPLPTSVLRREAGLAGRAGASRFDRALQELQRELLVVKAGVSDANRWRYCYIYEVLCRWLPEEVARGQRLPARDAMQTIVSRYVQVVVATTAGRIAQLFGWTDSNVASVVEVLVEQDRLKRLTPEGSTKEWLVAGHMGAAFVDRCLSSGIIAADIG